MLQEQADPRSSYDVPKPDTPPATFYVVRHYHVSSVDRRTGYVAEGTQFSDGTCVVHWVGQTPCTHVWRDVVDFFKVHGHPGTMIEWVHGEPGVELLDRLAMIGARTSNSLTHA